MGISIITTSIFQGCFGGMGVIQIPKKLTSFLNNSVIDTNLITELFKKLVNFFWNLYNTHSSKTTLENRSSDNTNAELRNLSTLNGLNNFVGKKLLVAPILDIMTS